MNANETLRGNNWWQKVLYFYVDGFKSMTVGRTLWAIIILKIIIFFLIVKLAFFPDFLNSVAGNDEEKADYVRHEMGVDRK
ncbi:MAG: DUF4492 domain-containing protein [Muribaculaceae bacterium]|nr:DUF4492 domain-containing protein [Muribaculaceae bacterium]